MTFLFTTQRLQVRPLNLKDLAVLHKMHSNPKVMQYTGSPTNSIEGDQKNLTNILECYEKPGNGYWIWGVERKTDNTLIGTCAILSMKIGGSKVPEDEIGYRFLEEEWGNGYGSEITYGLMLFAFTEFGKEKLVAEVDELNIASVKILEKQMNFVAAYYSEEYQSNDRKYTIDKADFLANNNR